jgi:hypothetical protein
MKTEYMFIMHAYTVEPEGNISEPRETRGH